MWHYRVYYANRFICDMKGISSMINATTFPYEEFIKRRTKQTSVPLTLDIPELLPSAIEEVLRYRAIVHTLTRIATVDTVFSGQEIKAGELVLPLFASANFD